MSKKKRERFPVIDVRPDLAVLDRCHCPVTNPEPTKTDTIKKPVNTTIWIPCAESLPPENVVVDTKIDDGRGVRNEAALYRMGRLWVLSDGSMYVYYAPTHWKERPQA